MRLYRVSSSARELLLKGYDELLHGAQHAPCVTTVCGVQVQIITAPIITLNH